MKANIVLILLVLFSLFIFGCTDTNQQEEETVGINDTITNGLSIIATGGSITTQPFTLQKGVLIQSTYFSIDGFDPQSVIFASSKEISLQDLNTNYYVKSDDLKFSSFEYSGIQNLKVNAKIICEPTGTSLFKTLTQMNIESEIHSLIDSVSYCGGPEDDYEYSPCCLVIIQRDR